MSQVHTALDHQAGSYINCLRTMSQFRWSSHWTLTLSHWPAILEGSGVDGRTNGTPGTQITMVDYSTWFVWSLVLVGIVRSYVDLTRGRLHLFKFCKTTISYLSFQEVYKPVFWTGWQQVHNCRNFKTNLLWEDQTLVHSCFLWLGKKKILSG